MVPVSGVGPGHIGTWQGIVVGAKRQGEGIWQERRPEKFKDRFIPPPPPPPHTAYS